MTWDGALRGACCSPPTRDDASLAAPLTGPEATEAVLLPPVQPAVSMGADETARSGGRSKTRVRSARFLAVETSRLAYNLYRICMKGCRKTMRVCTHRPFTCVLAEHASPSALAARHSILPVGRSLCALRSIGRMVSPSQIFPPQSATCIHPLASTSYSSGPGRLTPHHTSGMRLAKPRRRAGAVSATTAEAGDGSEGDQHVQENLVSMLRIQIGKQTVNDIADSESEKLRQSVDEVRPSRESVD